MSTIPCRESDGIGAALMPVVCAWCGRPMGAKVCVPAMAGQTSHGMCRECLTKKKADFDRKRGLSCAVSSATAGRDRRNFTEAPSCPAELRRNGETGAGSPIQPSEHAAPLSTAVDPVHVPSSPSLDGNTGMAGPGASVTFNGDHNR